MLIQKAMIPDVGDVVAFKLTNGDEIIGKLLSIVGSVYNISKPIVLVTQMVGNNQAQLGFMPFMAGIPEDVSLSFNQEHMIVKPTKARSDVTQGYTRATSNIAIPNAQTTSLLKL